MTNCNHTNRLVEPEPYVGLIPESIVNSLSTGQPILGEGAHGVTYKILHRGNPSILKVGKEKGYNAVVSFLEEAELLSKLNGAGGAPELLAMTSP